MGRVKLSGDTHVRSVREQRLGYCVHCGYMYYIRFNFINHVP